MTFIILSKEGIVHNTLEEWMELSLWLWETHNAVNLRLFHEQ